jgi:hypothetical protein
MNRNDICYFASNVQKQGSRLRCYHFLRAFITGYEILVICATGYIKSANDESLARDEGGDRNLFMEVVSPLYVQDRTRASIAHDAGDGNIFFPSVSAAARRTSELRS